MKMRHIAKGALKMVLEADANVTTLIVRATKRHIFEFLDWAIPDEAAI